MSVIHRRKLLFNAVVFFSLLNLTFAAECLDSEECQKLWPNASCKRGRCHCGSDFVRRKVKSFEWVCLALTDAGKEY